MTQNMIKGLEYPLSKVFSAEFEYHIPQYQRPYAWTTEEAGTLLSDLVDFYETEKDDNYFLGSIVLIKRESIPYSEVIDGQQRLTTLTILFSVIVSLLPEGKFRWNTEKYVNEEGNPTQGLKEAPRFFLRDKDQPFFHKYIQKFEIEKLAELDAAQLDDESQMHIRENAVLFADKLKEQMDEDSGFLEKFVVFLTTRCYLVTVSTPSQPSAYRVFSVMNSRGLDLLPMDIIKANVIAKIADEETRALYAEEWEDLETMATRKGFDDVFAHTRMIFSKKKAKRTLNEEFQEYVLDTGLSPESLIDEVLSPYTEAYLVLTSSNYEATENAKEVNDKLSWLNRIDNADWIPPAIKFLSEKKEQSEYVAWFFTKLERLASYMHAASKDVNQRINRYAEILTEMEERPDHSMNQPLTSVDLTEEEKREFIGVLDGEIYLKTSRKRNYIILRLDSFVSDGAASYDSKVLTIEHVLPQTVSAGSEWEELWPDQSTRQQWLNRIANLVPLSRQKNSKAQNYDFAEKKTKYFTGREGTSSFALTTQVLSTEEWIPQIVEQRQKDLLQVFKDHWDL